MIHPSNTVVIWGEYTLNEMFNIISIGKPPAPSVYSLKQEIMPNGKSRKIATVNSNNDLTITVDGSVVDRSNFEILNNLFNNIYTDRLRLVNSETGDILVEYKSVILSNNDFLENIDDGNGTNATITFNCINEI